MTHHPVTAVCACGWHQTFVPSAHRTALDALLAHIREGQTRCCPVLRSRGDRAEEPFWEIVRQAGLMEAGETTKP